MRYLVTLVAASLAAIVAVAGPAGAADPAPTFSGCGKFAKDSPSDATDTVADPAPDEVEIENAWFDVDASTATMNMTIKNLTGTVPPPATSITYDALYGTADGATHFVRAYIDFSGMTSFEYGHTEPLAVSTRYAYDGAAEGKLFTGQHGVVQVKVPPEAGAKPGGKLSGITAETQLGRTTVVPGAVNQSPTRGLSFQDDNVGVGSVTIAACDGATPGAPAGAPVQQSPSGGSTQQTAGPLPLTLVTKSAKKAKAKKTVKLKVKSSEALTSLAARISKGSKVYGTGKLASVNGAGTFKVKLSKALKKGTYLVAFAGKDSAGRPRTTSFKLKVK
jgi:hypothetical protein